MGAKGSRARIVALLLIGVAAAAPAAPLRMAAGAANHLSVPPIVFKSRKLANGLTVYTLRDTSTPNVSVSVWYDVGSKHDPEGRSGFAHLFEHILSRKTVNMPYNMVNRLTEDVGGVRNASTWNDRTNYYEIVPAQYLETMLWTHAERMARPVVDSQVFETERNVVKEELRQSVLAPPYGRLFNFVLPDNSFDDSPNRRSTIGSLDQLNAATLEDARAFHEAYYGPDTASLIVAGNFDETQLQAWVDEYFAAISPRAKRIPLAITEVERPRTSPRAVTAYAPNVPLPVVATSWKIPGSAHPDVAPLLVLDAILTGGDSSRLHKSLVHDRQLATQVAGDLADVEDGGYYAPYAIVAGGKTVEAAEQALAAEIDRIRATPVTAAELAEAKNELIAASLRQRETFSGRAFEMGEALVRTGDPHAADKRLAAIQRVTATDVQRVARKYLAAASRVDIRYLDEKLRPQGQADNWANPVRMPRFRSVPPATRVPNQLADEGSRQAPPAPSGNVSANPPSIVEKRLPNGLGVVIARTGNVPLATMTLVIKGGASTDPADKAGLASMAADLATKGTGSRSAEEIAAQIESLGAVLSSSAGADGLTLSVSAPTANLEAVGRILADIAQDATFPAAELERERKRSLDTLSIAMRNPGQLAGLLLPPILYGQAPYGSIASGTPRSIASLTQADLTDHYRRWWQPANASLIVAGGIDPAAASSMAERLFGSWRGEEATPQLPAGRAGRALGPRTIVVDMPNAGQAAVVLAVRTVSRGDPDYYALLVANAVLGAGSNGRLFQEVRVKKALSYGAYSSVPSRMDAAVLSASAQTKNETAAEVAQIFLAELERLGKEPLAADAIAKRQAFINGGFNRQAETSTGFGAVLAGLVQQGLSPAEATRYTRAVESVTAESAGQVAARLVSPDAATLIVVGDASKFIDKLRALRPNLELIPIDQLDLDAPVLRSPS